MFGFKQDLSYQEDLSKLVSVMERISKGELQSADEKEFSHPETARALNRVLDSGLLANNLIAMRLNESMATIGDSSKVRTMLEEVIEQNKTVQTIEDSGNELKDSISAVQSSVQDIQKEAQEMNGTARTCTSDMNKSIDIMNMLSDRMTEVGQQVESFRTQLDQINSIIDSIKDLADNSSLLALNASIEAARAGESGRGFAVVAQQMGQLSNQTTSFADDVVGYVANLNNGITALTQAVESTAAQMNTGNESLKKSVDSLMAMDEQIEGIGTDIGNIYQEINHQSELTKDFIGIGTTMAQSYNNLYDECLETGKFLYKISRNVDGTRGDMARLRSKLPVQDWLNIFKVDHLIFTWRLYNMIVGFETLRIDQLNNPNGCKLGKWLAAQTDPAITSSEAFKNVKKTHEELHRYACDCFNANQSNDREAAMTHFESAYRTYQTLMHDIDRLKSQERELGNRDETDTSKATNAGIK